MFCLIKAYKHEGQGKEGVMTHATYSAKKSMNQEEEYNFRKWFFAFVAFPLIFVF